jgi:hypothetical protein
MKRLASAFLLAVLFATQAVCGNLTYRTDGAWGTGKGSPLTWGELDTSLWELDQIRRTDTATQVKGTWYVSAPVGPRDDSNAATVGTLAWVLAKPGVRDVVIPANISISGAITVPSNVTIRGLSRGVTVTLATANQNGFDLNGVNNVVLENFSIVGTGTTTGVERGIYVRGAGRGCHLFRGLDISNTRYGIQLEQDGSTVTECAIHTIVGVDGQADFGGYGILADGSSEHFITRNRFWEIIRHSIYFSAGASRSFIEDNQISNARNSAIIVYSKTTLGQPACTDLVIARNLVNGVTDPPTPNGGQIRRNGIELSGNLRNVQVLNNTVINAKNYSYMVVGDQEGTPTNVLLQGNISYAGTAGPTNAAFYCEGSNGTDKALAGLRLEENVVSGGTSFGIQILNAAAPRLRGGRVVGTTDFSVKIGAGSTKAWVSQVEKDNDIVLTDSVGTVQDRRILIGATGTIATGTTVTHGLGATPSQVFVSGQIPGDVISFSNRTDTGFDVSIVKSTDGSNGTPQPITWAVVE